MSLANSSWCLWRFSISNLRASAKVVGNGTWERPQCLLKASCSEDSEPARVSVPWLWGYGLRRLSIKLGIVTRTLGHQQQMGNADGSCTYQPAAVSGLLQLGKSLQTETPTTCSDHTSDHSSYQQLTEIHRVLTCARGGTSASRLWISSTTGLLHVEICWRMLLPHRLQAMLATCAA